MKTTMKGLALLTVLVTVTVVSSCDKNESNSNGLANSAGIVDLGATGTANCYIVTAAGNYKFNGSVKGNSTTALDGTPASVEVLWESFGTSTAPSVGDIVNNVSFAGGYVSFTATGKKGNAVIAVKDASSNILWSWHIWCTDQPAGQAYNNKAGTFMDRDLGATSATPGDAKALGLLYQWGRKDPFLGGCSISYNSTTDQARAASTLVWPAAKTVTPVVTIEYAVAHPTTFITTNEKSESYYDWDYDSHYSTHVAIENTRWQPQKTIYDPCPKGWRVPSGGESGEWATALGTHVAWVNASNWDSKHKGMNFGSTDRTLGKGTIWYPAAGTIDNETATLQKVGVSSQWWSCKTERHHVYSFGIGPDFGKDGCVSPMYYDEYRSCGRSVRCVAE